MQTPDKSPENQLDDFIQRLQQKRWELDLEAAKWLANFTASDAGRAAVREKCADQPHLKSLFAELALVGQGKMDYRLLGAHGTAERKLLRCPVRVQAEVLDKGIPWPPLNDPEDVKQIYPATMTAAQRREVFDEFDNIRTPSEIISFRRDHPPRAARVTTKDKWTIVKGGYIVNGVKITWEEHAFLGTLRR